MSESCEMLETCQFYNAFSGDRDIRKKIWGSVFCWNLANSAKCVRKKVRTETGQPPPANMSPLGKLYNETDYQNSAIPDKDPA